MYVCWFPQRASDYGYKLGNTLVITMGKENNYCEMIYRSWVRIPITSFLCFIILDNAILITTVELKIVMILFVFLIYIFQFYRISKILTLIFLSRIRPKTTIH